MKRALTLHQAEEIRKKCLTGISQKDLAEEYGVSKFIISRIINKRQYKSLREFIVGEVDWLDTVTGLSSKDNLYMTSEAIISTKVATHMSFIHQLRTCPITEEMVKRVEGHLYDRSHYIGYVSQYNTSNKVDAALLVDYFKTATPVPLPVYMDKFSTEDKELFINEMRAASPGKQATEVINKWQSK